MRIKDPTRALLLYLTNHRLSKPCEVLFTHISCTGFKNARKLCATRIFEVISKGKIKIIRNLSNLSKRATTDPFNIPRTNKSLCDEFLTKNSKKFVFNAIRQNKGQWPVKCESMIDDDKYDKESARKTDTKTDIPIRCKKKK